MNEPAVHTQNSVKRERPQNKHLKPFKSRAELGGQLDPRINKGGRPKIAREETAAWLEKRDKTGKTNARKMVEALGAIAIAGGRDSVSAFREIRQIVEQNTSETKNGAATIGTFDLELLRLMQNVEIENEDR